MSGTKHEKEAKKIAKDRDNWKCRFCGITNEEHKREHNAGLHAHHIIKQKDNGANDPDNLITVCKDCHVVIEKTQADGLSQLRGSILSEIKESSLGSETDEPDIRIGNYYYLSDSGRVHVLDFETKDVAAGGGTGTSPAVAVKKEVAVVYKYTDRPLNMEYKLPLFIFERKVVAGGERRSDATDPREDF
jgi:hypothetical protein